MSNELKLRLLKTTLRAGAVYYLVGGFVHFFGLTLFPFYDGKLYAPYHDSVLAFVALMLASLLIIVARNPLKNVDILNFIIVWAFLASIFSMAIVWKVDFAALGAPDKKAQTIVEGILGFIFVAALLWLYPRKTDQ